MPKLDALQRAIAQPVIQAGFVLLLLTVITLSIYWPGLNGAFHLDDFQNLAALKNLPDGQLSDRLLFFVFNGQAGPAGRPISLATFLLNDISWPSQAWSFKYTNLLIHLLNGILIFVVALRLLPLLPIAFAQHQDKHILCAGLCAMLWTWHPLQLTTVLYVIQRMTELTTLFMLLGIIAYLNWRPQIDQRPLASYIKITLALGACSLLALLSKENGALIFLYLLLLEYVLLQPHQTIQHKHWRKWRAAVLVLPNIVILAYLGAKTNTFSETYQFRNFSLWERMLSECRVLFEYLYHIFLPKLGGNGLYHDDYVVSRGLLDPATTLFAVIGIIALLFAAFKYRQKHPLLSFAVLWFFASHVLESTFLPLELYFEHRNYLAIFGICLALPVYVMQLPVKVKPAAYSATFVVFIILATFTRLDASFWGQPTLTPFIWAEEHPKSIRAAQDAAKIALEHNDVGLASKLIDRSLGFYPADAGLLMESLVLSCFEGKYKPSELDNITQKLQNASYSSVAIRFVKYLHARVPLKECPDFSLAQLASVTQAFLDNPRFHQRKTRHVLYYQMGNIAVANRNLNAAMENLDKSSEYQQSAQVPLEQTKLLISAGLFDDAFRYIKIAREYDNTAANVFLRHVYKQEIDALYAYLDNWTKQHQKPPAPNNRHSRRGKLLEKKVNT